jgi:hypothetical protein
MYVIKYIEYKTEIQNVSEYLRARSKHFNIYKCIQ